MAIPEAHITSRIQAWRDSLIDLTKRNPLLSLPPTVIRLESDADDLWKLPSKGKRGALRLMPAPPAPPGADANGAAAPPAVIPPRTQHFAPDGAKRLNDLRLKARLSLAEQGINILFVTLGVLEWRDPKLGETIRSPILLLPVELDRMTDQTGFLLSRLEDDAVVNPTLAYRLAQADVNVALPVWDDDEENTSPSRYLQALVEQTSAARPDWRVIVDECLLGRFSYLRLAMYEDLSAQAEAAAARPIIRALAGDADALQALPTADVPEETGLDTLSPAFSFHVLPADPSQEQAVLAARLGQSFVLQGPPGTGKSQTIANIIAACIADGRRVLFVSEKMAALEAVYKRLQAAGLADFCLEAHSHKANKRDILEQLRAALQTQPRAGIGSPDFPLLQSLRAELDAHVAALHERRQPLGRSIYEVRGIAATLAGAPDLPFLFASPADLTAEGLNRCEVLAERLAGYHDLFASLDSHPWSALKDLPYSAELHSRVRTILDDLLRHADTTPVELNALRRSAGLPPLEEESARPRDVDAAIELASLLETTPRPLRPWLELPDAAAIRELRHLATATQAQYARFERRRTDLLTRWDASVFELPHDDMAALLLYRSEPVLRPALGDEWGAVSDSRYSEIDAVLVGLHDAIQTLQGAADRLCGLAGLPPAATLSEIQSAVDIAALAAADPRPRPTWFRAGGLAELYDLVRTARKRHNEADEVSASLDPVYEPGALSALDIDTLRSRFANDYSGIGWLLQPAYYRDIRALRGALCPGASLTGRNIVSDLGKARSRRNAEEWLADNATSIIAAFGPYYRGDHTDWDRLLAAMRQTETISEAFGEAGVPQELRDRLILSGARIVELRDQCELVRRQLREFDEAVARIAAASIRLPDADTVPLPQALLPELADWITSSARPTIASFVHARQQALGALRGDTSSAASSAVEETTLTQAPTPSEMARDILLARDVAADEKRILFETARMTERFGDFFSFMATDWQALNGALEWTDRLREMLTAAGEPLTAETIGVAVTPDRQTLVSLNASRSRLAFSREDGRRIWSGMADWFRPESLQVAESGGSLDEADYGRQREFAEERIAVMSSLERWLGLRQVRSACAEAGMLSFYEAATHHAVSPSEVVPAFRGGFYRRWLDAVVAATPELQSFSSVVQQTRRTRLARLEETLLRSNPGRIRGMSKERRDLTGRADVGEVGALRRLLGMRRPRASVRKILAEMPNLLGRLTPCLMMSPLSVSLFLDPDRLTFDLVIFDEASQVFVESALGALLRANQAVIAGDIKQLPPTSFFKGLQDDDVEDDALLEDTRSNGTLAPAAQAIPMGHTGAHDFDSILAAASAIATESPHFPERELTWHYRSKHESLIAFSRRNFYTRLETFPSASRPSALGFEHVPDGVYLGGAGQPRNNPVEAVRVADLVLAQLRAEPDRSVGVITMSEAQQGAIVAELDRRRTTAEPELARLLAEDATEARPEPVFVKNIENVQGDERDVIFLSIGYGRYPDGRMFQRFGPISAEGGERRINVAVTRARFRCTVVASILPADIVIREETRPGPRLLREFLEEARRGATVGEAALPADRDDDLLAETIAAALLARGHTAICGVGLFDYRVDVAVVDPEQPDRYLLGIECDSRVYASGNTACAREVLRADVLRGLGWRLIRVWSADWLRDPESVLTTLESAIDRARLGDALPDALLATDEPASAPPPPAPAAPAADSPYPSDQLVDRRSTSNAGAARRTAGAAPGGGLLPGLSYFTSLKVRRLPGGMQSLYGDSPADEQERVRLVQVVALAEGPLHIDAVAAYLAHAAGLNRAGRKIRDIAGQALSTLIDNGIIDIRLEGDEQFIWPADMTDPPARVPHTGEEPRQIEMVSRAEIGQVMLCLLRSAIGMRQDEAVTEAARLLGYDRTGSNVRARIENALADLECDSRIRVQAGQVYALEVE